eukprot:29952-Pelagococcus_subviridis.AAC.1
MDTARSGLSSQTRIVGSTSTTEDPNNSAYATPRRPSAGRNPPAAVKYGSASDPPPTAVPVMRSAASSSFPSSPCATPSPSQEL